VARSGSSNRWLERHKRDRFVKAREVEGYRSRAAFKLAQLAARDRLITGGARVLDLGASPGGWTQVACELAGPHGTVVAVDVLPMAALGGAHVVLGDCRDASTQAAIAELLKPASVDLVMSDMAPNLTGVAAIDEARMSELTNTALECATVFLRPGGALVIKLFQFADTHLFLAQLRQRFGQLEKRKPDASRSRSREFYVVAKQYGI
jgi:23S rRNA (uridine2552-2'-O)-methyltransferase